MTRASAKSGGKGTALAISLICAALIAVSLDARAQDAPIEPLLQSTSRVRAMLEQTDQPTPITGRERLAWIVDGVAGPRNVGLTALSQSSETFFWNTPEEQAKLSSFARGFAIRELDLAISRSVEAGVGAIWGEDPRPPRQAIKLGVWPKTQNALRNVVVAPRNDGSEGPAWGRIAGTVASGVAANTWLPENERTPKETALRVVDALASRFVQNLWKEFWPDIKARLPEPPWAGRNKDVRQ
jgi:hypothetical protein